MAHQVFDGSLAVSIDPPTTVSVTSEPTERSKPPLTRTKSWPAARMASGAARRRKFIAPAGSR